MGTCSNIMAANDMLSIQYNHPLIFHIFLFNFFFLYFPIHPQEKILCTRNKIEILFMIICIYLYMVDVDCRGCRIIIIIIYKKKEYCVHMKINEKSSCLQNILDFIFANGVYLSCKFFVYFMSQNTN